VDQNRKERKEVQYPQYLGRKSLKQSLYDQTAEFCRKMIRMQLCKVERQLQKYGPCFGAVRRDLPGVRGSAIPQHTRSLVSTRYLICQVVPGGDAPDVVSIGADFGQPPLEKGIYMLHWNGG